MRFSAVLLPLFFLTFLPGNVSLAQTVPSEGVFNLDTLQSRYNVYTTWCSPEKLYLHIDRTYYTVGETIWFNGYIRNSSDISPFRESNYIYVELLDAEGKCVKRVKIKATESGFPGSMEIPEDTESGYYTLRAYTLWQMNNSADYMFNQRIKILGAKQFEEDESKDGAPDYVDISFYPEGGRYFNGVRSRIGFKAMDNKGRNVEIEGFLMENGNDTLARFSTMHDGMGLLDFIPQSGTRYTLRSDNGNVYSIPAPSSEGATVNMAVQRGFVFVTINAASGGARYTLVVRDVAELRPLSDIVMDSRTKLIKVPQDAFRSGINHMLLVGESGNIVSERLFYIPDDEESGIVCKYTSAQDKPASRELIKSSLTLSDAEGNPLDGHFSISVVRGSFRRHVQNDGLVSYFRLSGELRGAINDPAWYFDSSVPQHERRAALDLLLMIQGWSYYDMPQIMRMDGAQFKLENMREYTQSIYGHIDRPFSGKTPEKFNFIVMIPKKEMFDNIEVEEGKNFTIDSLDFESGTGVLIKIKRNKLGINYLPTWDGDRFAPPYMYSVVPGNASAPTDKMEVPLVSAVTDTITAAMVTATPYNDDAMGGFLSAHAMHNLDIFADRMLIDYMKINEPAFEYDGEYMVNKQLGMRNIASTQSQGVDAFGEPDGVVKLIVDGYEQPWWLFESVYVENFTSIAISKSPEMVYRADGGIVSVCVRPGALLESKKGKQPSMIYFMPLGYQEPTYFYSPRYDAGDKYDTMDIRNTVYWSPSVDVLGGYAEVDFCNTDQRDYPFIVRIEGITENGRMFSHHCILDLKDDE